MLKYLKSLTLIGLCIGAVEAINMSGVVKDVNTGNPIKGATVGGGRGGKFINVKTGDDGRYEATVPTGACYFSIRAQGYSRLDTVVTIYEAKDTNFVNFELTPDIPSHSNGVISSSLSTQPAFSYSLGVLNLVNIKESGELSIYNVSGKLLLQQHFSQNCSTIPLPQNITANRTMLVVNISAGEDNLKQSVLLYR